MAKQKKTCKRCGFGGLVWGKVDGRFRLFEGESAHDCPLKPVRREHTPVEHAPVARVECGCGWAVGNPDVETETGNPHTCYKCENTGFVVEDKKPVAPKADNKKDCKFCWVGGLTWGKVDGKHALFEGSKPHACKSVKCGNCRGTGVYRWGPCINGAPPKFGGTCFQCQGTGTQHAKDMRRNHVYQIHAINRAFGGG